MANYHNFAATLQNYDNRVKKNCHYKNDVLNKKMRIKFDKNSTFKMSSNIIF